MPDQPGADDVEQAKQVPASEVYEVIATEVPTSAPRSAMRSFWAWFIVAPSLLLSLIFDSEPRHDTLIRITRRADNEVVRRYHCTTDRRALGIEQSLLEDLERLTAGEFERELELYPVNGGVTDPLAERGIPRDVMSFLCIEVFNGERPVLYVSRPAGKWCFLCGEEHPDDSASYRVVGIGHPIDDDPTLAEVLDLDVNEEAERAIVGGPWTRSRFEEHGD